VASLQWKKAYLNAVVQEIDIRRREGWSSSFDTLYFGGGTPSFLDCSELEFILNKVDQIWGRNTIVETSIEANPEDVTKEKMKGFRQLGFNRLTVGIQSFDDQILKRINRTHTAMQAYQAIEVAKASGFDNIGVDLIIGLPGSNMQHLEDDLKNVISLEIDHISVYILSLDSNSVFEKLSMKGKYQPLGEDELIQQYLWASNYLKEAGYEHYEISNFAKNFKYSKHNTSYWQQKSYLGVGAAAHSYDLNSRQWNVSHIKRYIEGLSNGVLYSEKETLTDEN
jgi:oxygen-independent coproporphyrinogen-3 oxidase